MKYKQQSNKRAKESFVKRYNMSPTEWRNKKKEWRANGEGIKIVEYMTRAYHKFLNK